MKRFTSMLILFGLLTGCAGIQKKKVGLQPGMTLFEATYLAGIPTTVTSGLDELYVKFGPEVWVVRNGFLSHAMTETYGSKVDAIKGKDLAKRTYFVKLTKEQENDLYSQSYAEMLGRALSEKGLSVVAAAEQANVLVGFDFKLNQKESVQSETEMVPVTSYTSSVQSNNWLGTFNYFSGNSYSGSTTTTMVPVVKTSTAISYDRGLEIVGKDSKSGKQLFVISVQSRGQSSDKRGLFAAMTAAAAPLMGKDFGQQLEFPVAVNDPLLDFLKTGNRIGLFSKPAVQWKGKTLDFCQSKVPSGATKHSPLTLALKLQQPALVDGLLACGADPSSKSFDGVPALAVAAEAGLRDTFTKLLDKGANPDATVTLSTVSGSGPQVDLVDYLTGAKLKEYRDLIVEARKKRTPAKAKSVGSN